jgi:hypothetical protein
MTATGSFVRFRAILEVVDDWEVMTDYQKARFWNDFKEFQEFKMRQRALRRGELSDEV